MTVHFLSNLASEPTFHFPECDRCRHIRTLSADMTASLSVEGAEGAARRKEFPLLCLLILVALSCSQEDPSLARSGRSSAGPLWLVGAPAGFEWDLQQPPPQTPSRILYAFDRQVLLYRQTWHWSMLGFPDHHWLSPKTVGRTVAEDNLANFHLCVDWNLRLFSLWISHQSSVDGQPTKVDLDVWNRTTWQNQTSQISSFIAGPKFMQRFQASWRGHRATWQRTLLHFHKWMLLIFFQF